MFAEFLFSLLVFPCGHASVGLTVGNQMVFLGATRLFHTLFDWVRLGVGGESDPTYMCARRKSGVFLLLMLAVFFPWGHGRAQ